MSCFAYVFNQILSIKFALISILQCRLIVSQMSNTRCESFHWMTPIYVICIAMGLWLPFLERFMLYFLFIVTTLSHWHYGSSVVNQMCEHFNRICFSVHMRQPITSATSSSNLNPSTSPKANGDNIATTATTATTTLTTNNSNISNTAATTSLSSTTSDLEEDVSKKLQ